MAVEEELARLQKSIEGYARDYGLDFFEVRYQLLDYRMINLVAAYDGFPTRYPHWRFGMEYDRLSKSYSTPTLVTLTSCRATCSWIRNW
jgi:stage V sporulation protein R